MQRIRIIFLGPFLETRRRNRYILVITDYFTKWSETISPKDKEAARTVLFKIWKLRATPYRPQGSGQIFEIIHCTELFRKDVLELVTGM
ncbi:hypothetical protein T05_2286 [Trichinella murrelli]|uniref:Integrase catalytic domain-containing protein n=1 Tax=Trichinella murrelli TaxID=144512 RepID=A0A0V0TEI6_9BILA|nr:hypothetical protein T05_2286 [Trichinella murrelli]